MGTNTDWIKEPPSPSVQTAVYLDRLRSLLHPSPTQAKFVQNDIDIYDGLIPASVLFPIVLNEGNTSVLFTLRSAHLKNHAGQISFPGGRVEPEDESPAHTAIRETEEEIGLLSKYVEIIGYLPEYKTITGFRVTPVVGLVTPPFDLSLASFEVEKVFEVPLAFLLDPANHQSYTQICYGRLQHFYAMTYSEYFIWGATAGIIFSLVQALTSNARCSEPINFIYFK